MAADVLIVGAGIGGLTLAHELERRGIPYRVFESAPEIKAVGVGINILPHASAILADLGLEPALARVAIQTQEAAFFNRFGQLIYKEPLGRRAGYATPQFSIHRGDLQAVLLEPVKHKVELGWHCLGFTQQEDFVELAFKETGRTIAWRGKGLEEVGVDARSGEVVIEVDPRYFRPTEVDFLLGDPSKAHRVLGWKHKTTFPELVRDMVRSDLIQVKREHDLHGQQHADD